MSKNRVQASFSQPCFPKRKKQGATRVITTRDSAPCSSILACRQAWQLKHKHVKHNSDSLHFRLPAPSPKGGGPGKGGRHRPYRLSVGRCGGLGFFHGICCSFMKNSACHVAQSINQCSVVFLYKHKGGLTIRDLLLPNCPGEV